MTGNGEGGTRAWLLSAYRADSHAQWADWLVSRCRGVQWQRRELPGRHFRWRIRGNPLSWLDALPSGRPDLIVATSMVDLATLRGLHPRLADVPAYYYFHENQFAYPVSAEQVRSVEPQIVQLYGALSARWLLFNSAFNRDSFLHGVEGLLRRMPDHVPDGVGERLADRARVLPVPVMPVAPAAQKDPRLVLWNHRWEYDKDPELFAAALERLVARGIAFRVALLGRRPDPPPAVLTRLRQALGERIIADGRVSPVRYRELLGRASVAVSTAQHEFQGLAMLEAASAGARPLVPDALCYPEQYAAPYRYPAGDVEALAARLTQWLEESLPAAVDVSSWHESNLAGRWEAVVADGALSGDWRGAGDVD